MVTWPRLSIQTFSPIQTWSPILSFQGYLMLTQGLITTPLPILAPNIRNKKRLKLPNGNQPFFMNRILAKYQQALLKGLPGLYQLLLNFERSTLFTAQR